MNTEIGPMKVDLGAESSNVVVQLTQKLIDVVNGENANVAAGALVAALVLVGKQAKTFSKEEAVLAVEQTWEAVTCE